MRNKVRLLSSFGQQTGLRPRCPTSLPSRRVSDESLGGDETSCVRVKTSHEQCITTSNSQLYCQFLKAPAKRNSFLYLSLMKEHDMAIVTSGFSPRPLLSAISANPVKVFKCFTKLNRSLCSSPLSGTLNFSLWIVEVVALDQKYRRWPQYKVRPNLLLQQSWHNYLPFLGPSSC